MGNLNQVHDGRMPYTVTGGNTWDLNKNLGLQGFSVSGFSRGPASLREGRFTVDKLLKIQALFYDTKIMLGVES